MAKACKHWAARGRYKTMAPWVAWCGASSKVFAGITAEVTCPACLVRVKAIQDAVKGVQDGKAGKNK